MWRVKCELKQRLINVLGWVSLTNLIFPQVFIVISLILGDGLYNLIKIVVITLREILNACSKLSSLPFVTTHQGKHIFGWRISHCLALLHSSLGHSALWLLLSTLNVYHFFLYISWCSSISDYWTVKSLCWSLCIYSVYIVTFNRTDMMDSSLNIASQSNVKLECMKTCMFSVKSLSSHLTFNKDINQAFILSQGNY